LRAQEQMVCPGTVHRPSLRCNKTTTECLPSLQRTPFLHVQKKNSSSSLSILLFLFQVDFFSRTKNPTDEKLVQSINTSHRDRSPPFWASSSPQTPNPICLDPSASDFSFGCCSISIREYLFYLAYQFDDRFAGNGNGKRKFTSPFFY
jgi:hypothetical protein